MLTFVRWLGSALLAFVVLAGPAAAADATVKVTLLDMTAMFGGAGQGPYGPGMMGPGYGPGMMGGYGPGYGPGMMGGYGPGMMGFGMMSIRTDKTQVRTGVIRFNVDNLSRSIVHEMAVVAVDSPGAPLPYDYNTARVPEKQVKILGETHDMKPGESKTLELTLPAGHYVLLCNVPGHYAAGMSMAFMVTPE